MWLRVVVCVVLASAAVAGQPGIERGTIIPVNGRRTTLVRIDSAREAAGRGFTTSQLAAFGIFANTGTVANAVVGYARDAAANVLPDTAIQLRSLTLGTVVAHGRTNSGGQFAFPSLSSGTYIVELLTARGSVVALSDAVSLGSGDIVQTIVQMSSPSRSFTGWVGGATTSAVNSAVEAGVLAIQAPVAASPES